MELQRKFDGLQAETRQFVAVSAELKKVRQECDDLAHERDVFKELADSTHGSGAVGAVDQSAELKAQVRGLQEELDVATRERQLELGPTPSGSVSQEKYDQIVETNQRLHEQVWSSVSYLSVSCLASSLSCLGDSENGHCADALCYHLLLLDGAVLAAVERTTLVAPCRFLLRCA
eukprot:SAG11_NODE_1365_length_5109_cov_2.411976_4_plen_175_part_00